MQKHLPGNVKQQNDASMKDTMQQVIKTVNCKIKSTNNYYNKLLHIAWFLSCTQFN